MIENLRMGFLYANSSYKQKIGCNNLGVIAAFFIAKRSRKLKNELLTKEELELKRAESKERREAEEKFKEKHKKDSDENLLEMVREKAKELGRPPKKHEVIGFACLKERFGPWPRVLEAAGVKTPKENKQ